MNPTGAASAEQTSQAPSRPRVIVDCDPGHDDMFALAVAASTCDVVGITVVAGNSPLANTERNARIGRDLMGLESVEVHAGAAEPLAGASQLFASQAHGRTGLDGPPERAPMRPLDGHDAVSYLVETTRAEEGLWLIAIGPLTNIALALRADPHLRGRIAGLSVMGGSTTHGNVTQAAEFNVYFDPEAASEVFSAQIPRLLMFGLNVTHQVQAGAEMIGALNNAATESSLFCAGLLQFSMDFNADIYGLSGAERSLARAPMHDPCAVLGVSHPELFTFAPRHVEVETTGVQTRGITHVDERPWKIRAPGPIDANAQVAYRADADQVLAMILASAISP